MHALQLRFACIINGTMPITVHSVLLSKVIPSYFVRATVTTPDEESDAIAILALSAVTGVAIQTYFPSLSTSFVEQLLTKLLVGRDVQSRRRSLFVVMAQYVVSYRISL